jgi:hypothetical protein
MNTFFVGKSEGKRPFGRRTRRQESIIKWILKESEGTDWTYLAQDIVTHRPIARQGLGKHIPAEAYARNNRTSIARQRISKQTSTIQRLCFLRGPCRGIIKEQRMSFERVAVEKKFEFWRWYSKVIEKKWQEIN